MPRSAQASTVLTSESTPALWPKKRGMKRFFAQRPLPSMTMATWRGMAALGSEDTTALLGKTTRPSDGHDLRFLACNEAVDLGDRAVGELLNLVERTALFVLADLLVLEELLGVLVGVAADVAHRHLAVLAFVADDLGELLAALFGERGHRHAQQVALRRRVEPEVGLADGLLDLRAHALFPGLHADRARVEQRHVGHLADGHHRAVVLHMHLVEDARVGAPGAHLVQLALQCLDRASHLGLGSLPDVRNAHGRIPNVQT